MEVSIYHETLGHVDPSCIDLWDGEAGKFKGYLPPHIPFRIAQCGFMK